MPVRAVLRSPREEPMIAAACGYILAQRQRFYPLGVPLTPVQILAMAGFFRVELLNAVRLVVPPVADYLDAAPLGMGTAARTLGLAELPGLPAGPTGTQVAENHTLSLPSALTFVDVLVSRSPFCRSSLFRALVHVEQFRQLGVEGFAELCVKGMLAGTHSSELPPETLARRLTLRFEQQPHQPFSVEEQVRAWMQSGAG
jgi:hypothetical protein